MTIQRFVRAGVVIVALTVFVSGCAQPLSTREKSTGVGALLGGATGAIVGAAVGNPAAGAAIGAGLGGVTGALVGDKLQQRDTEITQQEGEIQQQQQEIARNRQLLEELNRQGLDAEETSRGVVVNLPDVLFQFGQQWSTEDQEEADRDYGKEQPRQGTAWKSDPCQRINLVDHHRVITQPEGKHRQGRRVAYQVNFWSC